MPSLARFKRQPTIVVSLGVLIAIGVIGLLAPWIAPFDPETTDPEVVLQSPDGTHWLGTDNTGMDIFSRLLHAPRIDLLVATAATGLGLAIGTPFGLAAGYYRERVSDVIMRMSDVIMAFPAFILALGFVAVMGQGLQNVIIVIGVVSAPVYVRLLRSQVLSLREEPFVEAAKAVGNPDWRIFLRYLLPHSVGPLITQACINVGWAILITSGLAFLGVGIRIPTPEWGSMVKVGADFMITGQWWISFFPGLAIVLTVMAFNFLAEGVRDLLEPEHD